MMKKEIKIVNIMRKYSIAIVLLLVFIFFSIFIDGFFTPVNLLNLFRQYSMLGIVSLGMTLLIMSGAFDLSVGSIMALVGIVFALFSNWLGIGTGLILGILSGALMGAFNGVLVTKVKINAFVATLATALIFRGLALYISKGNPIRPDDPVSFQILGRGNIAGFSIPVFLFFIAILFFTYFVHMSKVGRYIFAVGGNSEASRLSGLNVDNIKILGFIIVGVTASIAGLIYSSRVSLAKANIAASMPLDAIAAVLIGGTSLAGGSGTIFGTFVGVMLLAFLGNGFHLLAVSPYIQEIIKGLIIIVAVAIEFIYNPREYMAKM